MKSLKRKTKLTNLSMVTSLINLAILIILLSYHICGVEYESEPPALLDGDSESSELIVTQPSDAPSLSPTHYPTLRPSKSPTTLRPTRYPTIKPTRYPSYAPTHSPTDTPTESWDNCKSSKLNKPKSKQKKKSDQDIDVKLLSTTDKSWTSVAIKIYYPANESDTVYYTKFQNDMITQHRNDFMLFGTFEHIPPFLNPKLQELPDGSGKRIYAYSGLFQIISYRLHQFSDIIQEYLADGKYALFEISSLNQQLLTWYKSIIELFQILNLEEVFQKIISKLAMDETMNKNGWTLSQKRMLNNTQIAFNTTRFTVNLGKGLQADSFYFLSAFYGYSCCVIWSTYFEEVLLMIRNSKIIPKIEADKYHMYTLVYFQAITDAVNQWNDCFVNKKPLNATMNVKKVFTNMLTGLTPYALIEFLYEWKYGPTSNKHKHRNVHIVIMNVNGDKFKRLIEFLNNSTKKNLKVEEYLVTARMHQNKQVFDKHLMTPETNTTQSIPQQSYPQKPGSTKKSKRKGKKK